MDVVFGTSPLGFCEEPLKPEALVSPVICHNIQCIQRTCNINHVNKFQYLHVKEELCEN